MMRTVFICFLAMRILAAEQEVDNGRLPKDAPQTLVFTTDLQFGADEDDDAFLWGDAITKIVPDRRGHIYIMDPKENRIIEFNNAGKLVRVVAKKGTGPGELQGIQGLSLLGDDSFAVLDGEDNSLPKVKFFDKDFNFVKEILARSFSVYPQTMHFSPNGETFFTYFARIDEETGQVFMKTGVSDRDFNVLKEFSSVARPAPKVGTRDSSYWVDLIASNLENLFKEIGVAAYGPNGKLYQAVSNKYAVTVWDAHFKKAMVVRKDYKPRVNSEKHVDAYVDFMTESLLAYPKYKDLITRSVLRRAVEKADLPATKNPIFGILPMEDGGFLVIHDLDLTTRQNVADIFSPGGSYLGQTSLPNYAMMSHDYGLFQTRMVFRNGFAYGLTTDEYGDIRAVRYKYALSPAKGKQHGG